jgi:hypothetical protein
MVLKMGYLHFSNSHGRRSIAQLPAPLIQYGVIDIRGDCFMAAAHTGTLTSHQRRITGLSKKRRWRSMSRFLAFEHYIVAFFGSKYILCAVRGREQLGPEGIEGNRHDGTVSERTRGR